MAKYLTILLVFTPTLVGVFAFGLLTINAGHVVTGITSGSVPLGGLPRQDAAAALAAAADTTLHTETQLITKGAERTTSLASLGMQIDAEATAQVAWRIGRSGNLITDLREQTQALVASAQALPAVEIEETQFNAALDALLDGIDEPAQDAALVWDARAQNFHRTPERQGSVISRSDIRAAAVAAAHTLTDPDALSANRVEDIPAIALADLDDGEALFEAILAGAPYTIRAADRDFTLSRQALAPWLRLTRDTAQSLVVVPDETSVRDYIAATVAPAVDREARDAVFDVIRGRVQAFTLAQDGQELDQQAATETLAAGISGAAQEPITLPVHTTAPAIGNDSAETLGINELLAVGETTFTGSPANRKHNIRVGAARYDGLLIASGQEFSFNQFLGPVDAAAGYKPELVIKPGGTVPEYGGGLCQVSTTAFQAAVKAGLKITQRRSHSYIVRYYGAPGFDATIYPPSVDLKFMNDTPGHILVQTEVVGDIIRFYFYGTDDGRETTISGPRTLSLNADGSGSAILSTKTTLPDGEIREQVFRSTYRSPALYPRAQQNPLE